MFVQDWNNDSQCQYTHKGALVLSDLHYIISIKISWVEPTLSCPHFFKRKHLSQISIYIHFYKDNWFSILYNITWIPMIRKHVQIHSKGQNNSCILERWKRHLYSLINIFLQSWPHVVLLVLSWFHCWGQKARHIHRTRMREVGKSVTCMEDRCFPCNEPSENTCLQNTVKTSFKPLQPLKKKIQKSIEYEYKFIHL